MSTAIDLERQAVTLGNYQSDKLDGMLSALLPGVRELRTPLVTGALWAACVWLAGGSRLLDAKSTQRFVEQFRLDDLPMPIWLGASAILVYLVGSLLVFHYSPLAPFGRRLRTWWHSKVERLDDDRAPQKKLYLPVWKLWQEFSHKRSFSWMRSLSYDVPQAEVVEAWLRNEFQRLSEDGRIPVMRSVFRGCGGPSGFEGFYHTGSVREHSSDSGFEHIESMLADTFVNEIKQEQTAIEARIQMRFPEVYAEIDRLKVESELRWSIFLPLMLLALLLTLAWSPFAAGLVLVPVLLLRDGNSRMRQASDKTWSVFTAGEVMSPILDDMANAKGQETRDFGERQDALDRLLGADR